MSETPTCLFCRFVARDIEPDVVAETELSLAFRDINPQAPTHVLVIPKRHVATAAELAETSAEELADVFRTATEVTRLDRLDHGYRLVFNTGPDSGQEVFHAHLHVLGGRPFRWPPG